MSRTPKLVYPTLESVKQVPIANLFQGISGPKRRIAANAIPLIRDANIVLAEDTHTKSMSVLYCDFYAGCKGMACVLKIGVNSESKDVDELRLAHSLVSVLKPHEGGYEYPGIAHIEKKEDGSEEFCIQLPTDSASSGNRFCRIKIAHCDRSNSPA